MISYKEKLPSISTIMLDVDGVLTTGDILLLDDKVVRTMHSRDGYALQYAIKKGLKIIIITGGNCTDVQERLEHLGVTEVFLKSHDKLKVYNHCKEKYGLKDEEILYMGDDIPDIPVMKKAAVAACPQDAAVDVKKMAAYQSPFEGGKGCVRDIIEQILRVQDKWLKEEAYQW